MVSKSKSKKKNKRLTITLTEKEGDRLSRYASQLGISRPTAIRRVMKHELDEYFKSRANEGPANQLNIFDSMQIDIFNNTSKTHEDC